MCIRDRAPWVHRGVSYWENNGSARIVWGTGDGYLIAVDAQTGITAEDIGENGRVDLLDGLPRATRGQRDNLNLLPLASQSAPLVQASVYGKGAGHRSAHV